MCDKRLGNIPTHKLNTIIKNHSIEAHQIHIVKYKNITEHIRRYAHAHAPKVYELRQNDKRSSYRVHNMRTGQIQPHKRARCMEF